MKALVINCRQNGLGIIRSLGEKKVNIIAVDHKWSNPGLLSKYVRKKFIVTNIVEDEERFIQEILEIGEREMGNEKIFLIPTNDEYVLTFTHNWERLKFYFYPVFETNLEVLLNCLDKTRMYQVAKKANVLFPKTINNQGIDYDINKLSFPVIVKPGLRRSTDSIKKNVFRLKFCRETDELTQAVDYLKNFDVPFIVQEYIPGNDDQLYTAGIFAYKGELAAGFVGRKLRQFPERTGECSYGESINDPVVLENAKNYVKTAGYTGIAQIEFKKHNGHYYLMEINPRSWSWNSLSTFSGVNLPYIGCIVLKEQEINKVCKQKKLGTWNFLVPDIVSNVFNSKNISLQTALKQAYQSDCHAIWDSKDIKPFIVMVTLDIKTFIIGLIKKFLRLKK